MNKIKFGDTHAITFTVKTAAEQAVDLDGTTVSLRARRIGDAETVSLPATLGGGTGEVIHQLDGTLAVGEYLIEVVVTDGAEITRAPTDGYLELTVARNLG